MIAIALGKVAVATAGTAVNLFSLLSAAQVSSLGLNNTVHKVEVWPDSADTGVAKVKINGNQVAAIVPPGATCPAVPYHSCCASGNTVSVATFSIDSSVNTNGPFVTLWVA